MLDKDCEPDSIFFTAPSITLESTSADLLEKAVNMALESKRTGDIMAPGCEQTGTEGMTKAVLDAMDLLGR